MNFNIKLIAVVTLAFVGATAAVLLLLLGGSDGRQNAALVLGFLAPIIVSVLAFQVGEVHKVVNSKHDDALAAVKALEAEVRRLNADQTAGTTPTTRSGERAPVTMGEGGHVTVEPKAKP